MRSFVAAALALGLLVLFTAGSSASAATVQGGASLSFSDGVGTPNDGSVFINNPFIVNVLVTSPDDSAVNRVQGMDYFIKSSAAGAIELEGRTQSTDYSEPYPVTFPVLLNPGEAPNLGSSFSSPSSYRSAGTYQVVQYTFKALSAGDYTISFDTSKSLLYFSPAQPADDILFASTGTYTVHAAVPEPASLSALALLMLGGMRSRRRSA